METHNPQQEKLDPYGLLIMGAILFVPPIVWTLMIVVKGFFIRYLITMIIFWSIFFLIIFISNHSRPGSFWRKLGESIIAEAPIGM